MLSFTSSRARIQVHDDCQDDFRQYMARECKKNRRLMNRTSAWQIAIEAAISNHPDWFFISFYGLKKESPFYLFNSPGLLSIDITAGMALLEATA